MEAVEKTLTYRDDTGLYRKLLPGDKDKDKDKKEQGETTIDESNYVELDNSVNMKSNGEKSVKVTFTGEGNRLSVIKCGALGKEDSRIILRDDREPGEPRLETPLPTKLPNAEVDSENGDQRQTELEPSDCSEHGCSESEELQYTDMYLNSKSESDDGASAVLSDHYESDTVEDESHYITTHEIQLTELDHDVDYDLGRGTCWDFEDDNLVYSFVDYASFEGDETQGETLILEGRSQAKVKAQASIEGPVISTEQDESDLCDSDKCASSDESLCKNQSGDANKGQIHVSIKTASWAVNEPRRILDSNTCRLTKLCRDRGHFSFESSDAREGPLCDRVPYFIPPPGRQHLATKLRRKDINEYSSGASSSVSELDDADKEVRNLTAKSFRSLACPYFDAINLRTSSESSVSEYGLNKWSTYMDFNCGNGGRSVIAHKTSTATVEMNKSALSKNRRAESIISMKASQTRMAALNKRITSSQRQSTSSKNIELKGPLQPKRGGVTLNFHCNVDPGVPESARRPKCAKNARSRAEITGTVVAKSGYDTQHQHAGETVGDTHKRAVFASSLLKNVISKKMQFEQERKMERGEICDTHPALSPCAHFKDQDQVMKERSQARGLQRQTSDSGSGFTVNSVDEQSLRGSRPPSCEPKEEQSESCTPEREQLENSREPPKAQLNRSQSSAFNSWKEDDEPETPKESEIPTAVSDTHPATAEEGLDASTLTELSELFVPSSELLSQEEDFTQDLSNLEPNVDTVKCEKEVNTEVSKEETGREGKTPEIKICLRSVKENKGCTLNIASLLTPKISYNTVNTFRTAADSKCHFFSASDKIPSFTVRDIRDNKCKFQTPIYHVRDVRKLVKSSYRFVSLDNSESKCAAASSTVHDDKARKDPVKPLLPSPIVIKCHSVKTNIKQHSDSAEAGRSSPKVSPETSQCDTAPKHCITSRVAPILSKHLNPDQSENQPNTIETKLAKQRPEKLAGESFERRNEPGIPKQAALEKLKAAVKTMEQLYVFDRNEWKRKSQTAQPITDSHVLPLIARQEQGGEEQGSAAAACSRLTDPDKNTDRIPPFSLNATASETRKPQEEKGSANVIHVPYSSDAFKTQSQPRQTFSNKSVLHFDNSNKAQVSISSLSNSIPQSSALQTPSTIKSSKSPVAPLSVKIEPSKRGRMDEEKAKDSRVHPPVPQGSLDSENYLTIPGLRYTNEMKQLNPDEVTPNVRPAQRPGQPYEHRSPLIMEYPASTIYHHPAAAAPGLQAQSRFSPSLLTVSPTPSIGETIIHTQRKMLLDTTTGHYYLVDTPIQPTTKRLFDPETGQYVDVPIPHSPVAPATPVPLPVSPLALSPGAYAPTYMIFPGFIPSPTLAGHPVSPQTPHAPGERLKHCSEQEGGTTGAESVYYSATGEAAQVPLRLPVTLGHVTARGRAANSERKPVISITTQQGPRIIAPPSFDGTTMSFVVEHR